MNRITKFVVASVMTLMSTIALANGSGGFDPADLPQLDLPDGWSVTAGASTDLVWRGITINDSNPSVGGNINYRDPDRGWYLGTSVFTAADTIDLSTDYVNTVYFGTTFNFVGSKSMPSYIQVKRHIIEDTVVNVNFEEFEFGVNKYMSKLNTGLMVAYIPEYMNTHGSSTYVSGYIEYTDVDLQFGKYTQDWTIGLKAGVTNNRIDDYADLKFYFGKQYDTGNLEGIGFEVAYHDTMSCDALYNMPGDITDSRLVGTISYSF